MQKINFYLLLILSANSLSLNGMFVSALAKRLKTPSVKRHASFVPSKMYPGKFVRLDWELTPADLQNSLYLTANNKIIKLTNLSEKEERYANALDRDVKYGESYSVHSATICDTTDIVSFS